MKRIIVALLLLPVAQIAWAEQESRSKFGFGVNAGTTGAGILVSTELTRTIKLRAHYNTFSYDTEFEESDITYDADFNKDNYGALLDWHPGDGSFRVTAGVYSHSDNTISVAAQPSGTYTLNGVVYNASDIGSVLGSIGFGKTVPYVGLGFGNVSRNKGLSLLADVGVQFQDSPDITLTTTTCNLPAATCTQLQSDLDAEIADIEGDAEDYDLWPVISLGLIYRF